MNRKNFTISFHVKIVMLLILTAFYGEYELAFWSTKLDIAYGRLCIV